MNQQRNKFFVKKKFMKLNEMNNNSFQGLS